MMDNAGIPLGPVARAAATLATATMLVVSLSAQATPPPQTTAPPVTPPQSQTAPPTTPPTQAPPQTTPPGATAPTPAGTQQLGGGQLPPVDKYVVGTSKPPAVPGEQGLDMTLEQAIQFALDHNISLQVARMNPQVQDYTLQQARAAYVPQFTGQYNYNNAQSPSTNTTEGVLTNISVTNTYNISASQSVPWYGGNYSASFNNSAISTNVKTSPRNPQFNSSLQFRYTQPLLANFKTDSNRTAIVSDTIQRQIVDVQLLATIENTKANVRAAYWALREAIEKIEISKRAEDLAKQLYDNDMTQYNIGTMAQIDTVQPAAQLASAEGNTLAAEIAWQQADLAFKTLLVGSKDDDLYKRDINPVDMPTVGPEPNIDIDAAVQKALTDRTDIQEAVKSLDATNVNLLLTKNQTLPQLNLTGGFTASGLGGPEISNGVVTTPGGYGDALSTVFGFNQPTWLIGATVTYPLGMKAQRAAYARAELQYEQQQAQLKVTQLSVATDVTGAGLNVENTYKQYQAAKKASDAQEQATDAEITKFQIGLSNNFNVVTQQNNLTSARLTELQALIAYINAVADFDRKLRIGAQ